MKPEDIQSLLERSKTLSKKIMELNKEYIEEWESMRDSDGIFKLTSDKLKLIISKEKALDDALKEFKENDKRLRQLLKRLQST